MPDPKTSPVVTRRLLLGGACAITSAAVATASRDESASESEGARPSEPAYRETEHIKTYYRLSRL